MRKHAAAAASVVALCALVGCSSPAAKTAPKPSPTTTSSSSDDAADCLTGPGIMSACTRLGDLTTLDPCSLVTLGQLPPDLDASPKPRESLDYCAFDITAGPDKGAALNVGQLASTRQGPNGYGAGAQELPVAGLNLEQGELGDGHCGDAVQFQGDLVDLQIDVYAPNGSAGSQSLCDAANEVGNALATVLGGKTQMQHFTVPKNSIAKLKACSLLEGTQVGGYAVGGSADSPSGHSCFWSPDMTNDNISLGVDLVIGPKLGSAMADSTSKIHGLDSYTFKDNESDYSRCEIDTDRAPWGSAGNGLVEIAEVSAVDDPGKADAACTLATQMANLAWPKLPAIS
ncbi:MAG TPA: hypothetical protein VHZ97_01630 [Pseudonocardiaceae bacterium]|nr:hypothetical protein [Pseudonocardiaceae bacterium]